MPKNGEKWATKGPKLGNMIISDRTFFGRYILSNLAKFGPKILKTVGGDTILVNQTNKQTIILLYSAKNSLPNLHNHKINNI